MLIQTDLPDKINHLLKVEKAKRGDNRLQDTMIAILKEYFKNYKEVKD